MGDRFVAGIDDVKKWGLIGVGTLRNGELGRDEIGVTARECRMKKLVGSGSGSDSGSPGSSPLSGSLSE